LLTAEAIGPLFRYAVHQERCGDTNLFDAILRLTRREFNGLVAPRELLGQLSVSKMCAYASPRATILAGPCIYWGQDQSVDAQDMISKWLAAISVAPRTKEIAGSVVGALLQIAANRDLRPSIPAEVWLWLNERPPLPSACRGLFPGSYRDVVQTVRGLDDIGILTSYLIITWSEWNPLDHDGLAEMRMSCREDFKGIEMGYHRAELIQRLDYILGELEQRPGRPYVHHSDDWLWHHEVGDHSLVMRDEYGQLKRILEEVDQEATEIPESYAS
jgi:hypothetical protein